MPVVMREMHLKAEAAAACLVAKTNAKARQTLAALDSSSRAFLWLLFRPC